MKFVVIEGIDGSGKSTQIKLLTDYLSQRGIKFRYIHFPRTDSPVYGELIARFLRGDFGSINAVDPYLVALLYAGDRKDAAEMINEWLNKGFFVILDRYVYSNIAFQCAKIKDLDKRKALRDWILNLEYHYHRIPMPDMNILLDVPFTFTTRNLTPDRTGDDREYLLGRRDIHEEDLDFQKNVRDVYLWQAGTATDLKVVNCVDDKEEMLSPEKIFNQILEITQIL